MKIFLDGPTIEEMKAVVSSQEVSGFTSNPTLARANGVQDYSTFCQTFCDTAFGKSVSLEVIADDLDEMVRQGKVLGNLGPNVYVKIPITNAKGISTQPVLRELSQEGIKTNVTAVFLEDQVGEILDSISSGPGAYISVFAGRIADTGRDPKPTMKAIKGILDGHDGLELLWASTREIYSVVEAEESGCDIITVTPSLFEKLALRGKDLRQYSLETVKMFLADAVASEYSLA